MSATSAPRASMRAAPAQIAARTQGGVVSRPDEVGGAGLLFVDVKIRSALIAEGRRSAITQLFGIPRSDQSLLVTTILIGAGAVVVRDAVAGLWRRPSGSDVAIGGALVNAMGRALAGAPSNGMPLAGSLIALTLLSRSLRPAVAESVHETVAGARAVAAAFGGRYLHRGAEDGAPQLAVETGATSA